MTDPIDDRLQRMFRERFQRDDAKRHEQAQQDRQKMDDEARQAQRISMATSAWDEYVAAMPALAQKITGMTGNNYKMVYQGQPNPSPSLRSSTLRLHETNSLGGLVVVMTLNTDLQLEYRSPDFDLVSRDFLAMNAVDFQNSILDLFDRFLNPKEA